MKIDKKQVAVDGQDVTLMLWDIYGQDDFQTVQPSQLRGMSGYLLVVDGTRRATLETARHLQQKATEAAGAGAVHPAAQQGGPGRAVGDRRTGVLQARRSRAGA